MPFENPETGQEFADFGSCVSTVMDWDGVDSQEQAESMCGSWQAATKNTIVYNARDPTQSGRIREKWQAALESRLTELYDKIPGWFDQSSVEYETVRIRFTDWFRQQLFDTVLERADIEDIRRGRHWTATYVRQSYRRGLQLARRDLQSLDTYTEFQIRQATRERKTAHKDGLRTEFNQGYAGLRDQMSRAMDDVGAIVREGVNNRQPVEWFITEIQSYIDSDMLNAARAHANTIAVDAVNEALLTSFESIGVEQVGVAPETDEADSNAQNYIRLNELPDPADPRTPDEAQWVTAGDDSVCPVCEALEGTVVKIENVRNKDRFLPPVHCSCRCRLLPIAPGR
jgi:hypothetical protein